MKAFVTGGTGFIGGHVVRKLRARGDDVVALVRSRAKAAALEELGCTIVEGDLSDRAHLTEAMTGRDSVFHIAADYRVGVPKSECADMHEANVDGTERVLDAGVDAAVKRIVYVSTVGTSVTPRGRSSTRPTGARRRISSPATTKRNTGLTKRRESGWNGARRS